MVDSRLSQGGEGRCVPKDSLCTFLELTADADQDEHHFRDADGNEYLLRLRGLDAHDGVGRQPQRPRRLGAPRQPAGRRRLALVRAQAAHLEAVHVELGPVAADSDPSRPRSTSHEPGRIGRLEHDARRRARPGCAPRRPTG